MEKANDVLNVFGGLLAGICSRTPLAKTRPLRWTIIVNPMAGGFTINSRWKKHLRVLNEISNEAANLPLHGDAFPSQIAKGDGNLYGVIATKEGGHARRIAAAAIKEALESAGEQGLSGDKKPFNLLITAGGDGTSLEVLTALYEFRSSLNEDFVVLRLPMGTGNDGADAWKLEDALRLLVKPAKLQRRRAVLLTTSTPGKGPYPAFNILSVGLDAFVTHMTNKMKGKLPGDSYKLWVDLAALFYDRTYTVGPMDVKAFDEGGNEVSSFREKLLLLAVGESGKRTYGSHKWILPDDRNVCAVRQMPLFRKLALKGLFTTGGHADKPESNLFNASRVVFSGEHPILAQMDGETVLLEKEDFPAVMELSPPVIPILTPAGE